MIGVFRGPESKDWVRHKCEATLHVRDPARTTMPDVKAIAFNFSISAGRGESNMDVRITGDSFADVASKMMEVDPDAAIRAFGAALEEHGLTGQKKKRTKKQAR